MGLFTRQDKERITAAIAQAERKTSGEIRVHIDRRGEADPLRRAAEVFTQLGMDRTKARNGVLFYLAMAERQFVILGDEGINAQVPEGFWTGIRDTVLARFKAGLFVEGLVEGIGLAGEALAVYFPYQWDDTDELSNEVSLH